jgi:hypothetical protein
METGAEVKILLKDRTYRCFHHRNGSYEGIGKQLWYFLSRLPIERWQRLEELLRKDVKWYADLDHDFLYSYISLTNRVG